MSLSLQNCWSNRNWLIGRPTQDSVSLAELALGPGNFGGALLQSAAEVGLWIRRLRRSFDLSILPISLNKSTYDKRPFRMVSAQVRWTASGPVLRRSILTAEAATKGSNLPMPYSPLAVHRGAPAPDPFVARRPSVCCRGHRLAIRRGVNAHSVGQVH